MLSYSKENTYTPVSRTLMQKMRANKRANNHNIFGALESSKTNLSFKASPDQALKLSS